jgi:hypothetical protein
MPLQWGSTDQSFGHGVKMLCYGQSGMGKTRLIGTLPNPIIASAESGLLVLRKMKLPYAEIKSYADLVEFYNWVRHPTNGQYFQSVAIDSISEIAEVILKYELSRAKDPRQAYGEIIVSVLGLVRQFRDLPGKHVYISAKAEYVKDDVGRMLWQPMMPGSKLGNQLAYFFDEVFFATKIPHEAKEYYVLQTQASNNAVAKDRAGVLQAIELPDLGAIINKIGA